MASSEDSHSEVLLVDRVYDSDADLGFERVATVRPLEWGRDALQARVDEALDPRYGHFAPFFYLDNIVVVNGKSWQRMSLTLTSTVICSYFANGRFDRLTLIIIPHSSGMLD